MKSVVIVDSSALFSLFIKTDFNHNKAKQISKHLLEKNASIIVPGEVFAESVNIVGKKLNHEMAITIGKTVLEHKTLIIVAADDQTRSTAFDKFQKQSESVSFTDCLVMAFADKYKTKEIFGFDEAFGKNGYKLPGSS